MFGTPRTELFRVVTAPLVKDIAGQSEETSIETLRFGICNHAMNLSPLDDSIAPYCASLQLPKQIHQRLPGRQGAGKSILTQSRIQRNTQRMKNRCA